MSPKGQLAGEDAVALPVENLADAVDCASTSIRVATASRGNKPGRIERANPVALVFTCITADL